MVASARGPGIGVRRAADRLGVVVSGRLDALAAPALLDVLRRVDGETLMELDLSDIKRVDDSGCGALEQLRDRAAWMGVAVVVARASPAVVQALAEAGLAEAFGLVG